MKARARHFSLRKFLSKELLKIGGAFVTFLLTILLLTILVNYQFLYLSRHTYPLQQRLYAFKGLVEQSSIMLQASLINRAPTESSNKLEGVITEELTTAFQKIKQSADEKQRKALNVDLLELKLNQYLWQAWKVSDIASSPGSGGVSYYYRKKILPIYYLLNVLLTSTATHEQISPGELSKFHMQLEKVHVQLIDYISAKPIYHEESLFDELQILWAMFNNAKGSAAADLLVNYFISQVNKLRELKTAVGGVSVLPEYTVQYFPAQEALMQRIALSIDTNRKLIIDAHKQIIYTSLAIFVLIFAMIIIFLLWQYHLVKGLMRQVTKPIETLMTDLKAVRDTHQTIAAYDGVIDEMERLFNTLQQMIFQRFKYEAKLEQDRRSLTYLAYHDKDSGANNYYALVRRLRQVREEIKATPNHIIILTYYKIQNLERIEDMIGRKRVNQLLRQFNDFLASLCKAELRGTARVNHTDFISYCVADIYQEAPMLTDFPCTGKETFSALASSTPFVFTAGISCLPLHTKHTSRLIAYARFAAVESSYIKAHNVKVFDVSDKLKIQRRAILERDILYAVDRGEITVLFQPQVCLRSKKIIGAEILMRWLKPEYGLIAPDEFISIAEESGAIVKIGRYIQEKAIVAYKCWVKSHNDSFKIAINASAFELNTRDYPDYLFQVLEKYSVPPTQVEVEITESLFIEDFQLGIHNINRLRNYGVLVAIDDFGTGYSALSRLIDLNVSLLKLDKSFLDKMFEKEQVRRLIKLILSIGNAFNLDCLVEGVESKEEADYLESVGFKYAQGYFFSKPVTYEQMSTLLSQNNR